MKIIQISFNGLIKILVDKVEYAHNSRLQQVAVTRLIEGSCFYSASMQADSFVLLNRHLSQAVNREGMNTHRLTEIRIWREIGYQIIMHNRNDKLQSKKNPEECQMLKISYSFPNGKCK